MLFKRLLLPLVFAFTLLGAQQGSFAHLLSHTQAEQNQQDKKTSHSPACDQCASYAQLGSALNNTSFSFDFLSIRTQAVSQHVVAFHSVSVLSATARGPPGFPSIA